ncbi:hypothetical protein TSAR_007572 [Trichomalopsis sarcophagae]|uniref:Uncharacterized protein n=1 Tax=Trichomalopsis sarcophagae TaxID=543379 RepID=A0A232ESJ7_9HYME|nr:hypothetical protein TSAR_007572 [Trichomalopsis sarcophagae]
MHMSMNGTYGSEEEIIAFVRIKSQSEVFIHLTKKWNQILFKIKKTHIRFNTFVEFVIRDLISRKIIQGT